MDSVLSPVREGIGSLTEPFEDIWGVYQGLDPEQQRASLLLALAAVGGLIVWAMYQAHGDRVVVVLPARLARYSLVLLVAPVVLAGKAVGLGWSMPGFLTRDWTAEPDPDRPEIPMKEVNPMKVPGKPGGGGARLSANHRTQQAQQTTQRR